METNFIYGTIAIILFGIWFIMTCIELFTNFETNKRT